MINEPVTDPPLLEARGLEMWRGERLIFSDLNLRVQSGEALHVRGPNGCGKTTLIRILCGLIEATEGSLYLMGRPLQRNDPIRHCDPGWAIWATPTVSSWN